MEVGKIAHASIVVKGGGVTCFMDPVFNDPFDSGACSFDPPVEVAVDAVQRDADVVILSHAHMDHFSPLTLALFDRATPVFYPEGEAAIERALAALGFESATPIGPGSRLTLDELEILPTTSKVGFPEMGVAFRSEGRTFWNVVDTVIDESVIDSVVGLMGRPDLLFAKYQPLVEGPLQANALGSDFPYEVYGELLRNVWAIAPRFVATGSCGYRYTGGDWLNDRGFPITERQFAADLRRVDPTLQVVHVPHASAVAVGDTLERVLFPYATRTTAREYASFDWRPDRGVPPLRDANPLQHADGALRRDVEAFLDGDFLPALMAMEPAWHARMRRLGVTWRLEIVYPSGPSQTRLLDFGAQTLRWSAPTEDAFVNLHTSVTASAVVGLLRGELSSYALNFNNLRLMHRIYGVHADGVHKAGGAADDPLGKVLLDGADDRYIDRQVQIALGRAEPMGVSTHSSSGGRCTTQRPASEEQS